jgi:hypothetical protein
VLVRVPVAWGQARQHIRSARVVAQRMTTREEGREVKAVAVTVRAMPTT